MTVKMTSLEKVSCKLTYALRFKKLVNAIHSAPDFHTVLIGLQTEIIKLYESQMVTIYLVDSERQELYSQALLSANKLKEIRIPIDGNSIAGYVAQTGNIVNIKNVHDKMELINIDADLSFDNAWDEKSGMKTKQVLAVPVLFQRKLLGVIQLINKKNGRHFTVEDQKHLFDLTETLGIAFHNLRKGTRKAPTRYDMLIKNGIISEADLVAAQTSARKDQKDVETVLIHDFKVSRQEMGTALSLFYDKPFVNLQHAVYNPIARVSGINIEYFRKTKCIPLLEKNGSSIFAVDNPLDQVKIQEVMRLLRVSTVDCHVALKEDIENFINLQKSTTTHHSKAGKEKSLKDILAEMRQHAEIIASPEEEVESSAVDDRAIVLLVKKIIEDAYKHRASDIHLEPNGSKRDAEVRFRIDGRCGKFLTIPKTHIKAVVSRLKILSKLDIAERRKPQDGKIKFRVSGGRVIELRVSTIPTAEGNEDVVLRLLSISEPLPLSRLMPKHVFEPFSTIVKKPYGIILVVGPTGSGKTTTLHSALGYINSPERKIWTAEDPVEISQHGLRQVQVNPKIGLTFAVAMRAFLRADPDVIMVGEMRDRETAAIGLEASLTGHLVLSTLHTNSAPETIIRLVDMGMDPFSFADAILGILAQRLVRTLCMECKTAYHPIRAEFDHLQKTHGPSFEKRVGDGYSEDLQFFRSTGCESCNKTGYKGRLGLYEFLLGSSSIKQLVIDRARVDAIRSQAMQEGMTTLLQEGIRNVFQGRTDFNQVMTVCSQ